MSLKIMCSLDTNVRWGHAGFFVSTFLKAVSICTMLKHVIYQILFNQEQPA